ncbi:toxin-antitoxin system YwqK family antitoxin [Rubrivirga sp.]|uniref:toxin-antitoxin system YwqK family antitoxin n=1 Tax=Rubrivirga sp. TaxID=1885344 RepID=UPI003C724BA9
MTRTLLAALCLAPLAALAQGDGDATLRFQITPAFPDTLTSEAYSALPDKAAFSGVVADRHPDGRLKLLRSVVRGQAIGLWTEWYPSGIVRYIGQWVVGDEGGRAGGEGVWLYFHENGRVRYREVYRADRAHGPSEQWHANGQKAGEGQFRDGTRVGRWRWWDETGSLDSLRTYPDGGPAWTAFEPGVISLPGIRETSPSASADGRTFLFARTADWDHKVPYLATVTDAGWRVERAAFADTVYKAALSPDGRTAFFQTHETIAGANGDSLVTRVVRSTRTASGWTPPVDLPTLAGLDAGYISVIPNGTLYLFAWQPRGGIYRAEPDGRGGYGDPIWLGDAVSPEGTTSFDALVHPNEDQLVISREVPTDRPDLGKSGFYLYRLVDGEWVEDRRLDLPFGWGATVLPDGRFLFVLDGDLQTVPLTPLGLDW